MPPAQSPLASSSPFPIRPKGLNPSFSLPGLRPPALLISRRSPPPAQRAGCRYLRPAVARPTAPPGPHNARATPGTSRPTPSARLHVWHRLRTALSSAAVPAAFGLGAPRSCPATAGTDSVALSSLFVYQAQFAAYA